MCTRRSATRRRFVGCQRQVFKPFIRRVINQIADFIKLRDSKPLTIGEMANVRGYLFQNSAADDSDVTASDVHKKFGCPLLDV
jgi:hypothetical protein